MKGGQPGLSGAIAAIWLFSLGGCAVGPSGLSADASHPVAERDQFAEAAERVEATKWPKPDAAPLFSWVTGGSGDRFTKADAVEFYVRAVAHENDPFSVLVGDATRNVAAGASFAQLAVASADTPRLTMNDVALLEAAIQALRENRDIYQEAANDLRKGGASVDPNAMSMLRQHFDDAIRSLGAAADMLANRIDQDRSETLAAPASIDRVTEL